MEFYTGTMPSSGSKYGGLQIYTLGRFEITRNGKKINFSGKTPHKQLAMLKSIIALGNNGAAKSQIAEILWPDSDGDVALISFDTTLHRLRRLLESSSALHLADGRLSLNPSRCWVDLWEFQKIAAQIESLKPGELSAARRYLEQLFYLYRGNFLEEEHAHWVLGARESSKSRFISSVLKAGKLLEEAEMLEEAIECFQNGLRVDTLAEEFYQQLMICYQKIGQENKAMDTYNLCQNNLHIQLGLTPSSKTRAICSAIRQGRT